MEQNNDVIKFSCLYSFVYYVLYIFIYLQINYKFIIVIDNYKLEVFLANITELKFKKFFNITQ